MSNCSTLLVFRVWQEWEVENNTFVSMEMQQGDDCGQIRRSVKVLVLKWGGGGGVFKCLCTCSDVCLKSYALCMYMYIFWMLFESKYIITGDENGTVNTVLS